jgi:hypothetical protein
MLQYDPQGILEDENLVKLLALVESYSFCPGADFAWFYWLERFDSFDLSS